MLIPVVLSGGAGTRLWPVSREIHPKPFMVLDDGESLLQKTLQRLLTVPYVSSVVTITNRELYFKTRDEYETVVGSRTVRLDYLLEPCGRNTAPAIAAAALHARDQYGPEACLLVLPSDHLIQNQSAFAAAATHAAGLAEQGHLVTFGIQPQRPETGFGYIQVGDSLVEDPGGGSFMVKAFVEKPDPATAQRYLDQGGFLWNSGMFCFRADVFLDELKAHAPDVFDGVVANWAATDKRREPIELDAESFARVPGISVDYAVMEKSARVAVVPCDFDWNDIGSWHAFSELSESDESGNRISGEAVLLDTRNSYVKTEDRLVATVGVENLMIVDTPDALLVAHRDSVQDVKEVAQQLKAAGHETYKLHRTVHRPWGTYTVLEEGPRFKIKRIVVKPEAILSLQYHHHRSEHWVVVSGMARVDDGQSEQFLGPNESTYIPAGNLHRLGNPGVKDLVMIEIQCGEYLGEDDIVRVDDRYGRVQGDESGGDSDRDA